MQNARKTGLAGGKKTHIAVAYTTKTTVHAINQYDAVYKQNRKIK
jgi:hypothetical protein